MRSLEERMEVGFVIGEGLWLVKAREDGGEEGGNGECVVRASLALSHLILQQPFKGGCYYYSHFTDAESGAHSGKSLTYSW